MLASVGSGGSGAPVSIGYGVAYPLPFLLLTAFNYVNCACKCIIYARILLTCACLVDFGLGSYFIPSLQG